MRVPSELYALPLTLLTDLYQLTMAYGYWKSGVHDREAVFNLTFRKNPFQGGYTVAAGLGYVLDFLGSFRFGARELGYLAELRGADGAPLFDAGFLEYLGRLSLSCDVDAVPEGTIVFPQEPLVRVKGPLIECQLLETPLLNMINFQSLVATKAARICQAARGEPVLEFGLRRAQGIDGALAASRAAYIGGCAATSNVLAGQVFGIPVKGTHAHSWVLCFDDELEAFQAYADAMPGNCVFLVDTFDTLAGVQAAVEVGKVLRERGQELLGVRLDSGDLAYLSQEARKILDRAGFTNTAIVASNDLDEHLIQSLKEQGAAIGIWGVGTKLVTAYDQPALGGVYKLAAVRKPGQAWQYKVKVSEQNVKISTPGITQVRRFLADDGSGQYVADMIYDEIAPPRERTIIVDPLDPTRRREFPPGAPHVDLLQPVLRGGRPAADPPAANDLEPIRARLRAELARFHSGIRRFLNPHAYPVGLEQSLYDLRTQLVLKARGLAS